MAFADAELEFLRSQPLARVATVSPDGQPDVVPVAFEFDGSYFWIGGSGETVLDTRKFRNVAAGNSQVALVVDDLASFDPFVARSIRVDGRADGPIKRVGMVGPGIYLRITPTVSWSWNIVGESAGQPVGETWYEATRMHHDPPPH